MFIIGELLECGEMRTKYRNKKCRYGNRTYHSRREASDALWLDSLLKQGKIKEVKAQHKIPIYVNDKFICSHYVDFKVTLNSGEEIMVECKGFWTELYRLKLKLVHAVYPDMIYLINPNNKILNKHLDT